MRVVEGTGGFVTVSGLNKKLTNYIRYEVAPDYRYFEHGSWHVHLSFAEELIEYAVKFCGVEVDASRAPANLRNSCGAENAWAILHLRESAPLSVVKAAYRVLSFEAHPDRGGSGEKAVQLNNAYQKVISEHSRRD